MNFNKEETDQLLYLLKKANKDPIYELECIIGSNFKRDVNTKTDFINVLKRLKGRFTRMTSNNVLLISFSNEDREHSSITKHISRVVLNGNGLISHYAKHNKLNNLLPTYWNHDRNNLDKIWLKNKKKPYLSKIRNKKIQKFNNSLKLINKPQGTLGKWLYNNKYYFKLIDNKFAKMLFFIIGVTSHTRHYYIKGILKKFKMI